MMGGGIHSCIYLKLLCNKSKRGREEGRKGVRHDRQKSNASYGDTARQSR